MGDSITDALKIVILIVVVIAIVAAVILSVVFIKKRGVKNRTQYCSTCEAKITSDMVRGHAITSQKGNKIYLDVAYFCANCNEIKHIDIVVDMAKSDGTQSVEYLIAKYFEY